MYFDYNAMAPLRPSVRVCLQEALELLGNPSSTHRYGRYVRAKIEHVRDSVADYFHTHSEHVIFTSGATEANAMVLKQHPGPVFVSAVEHDSVYTIRPDATIIPVDHNGIVKLEA